MRNEIRSFEPTMSAKRTLACLRSASQQASEANNFQRRIRQGMADLYSLPRIRSQAG
jgi:hypothetical protein